MYFRISKKKEKGKVSRYIQLARSIRVGRSIKTKVIAHLGLYEEFIEKEASCLLKKLSRITSQEIEEVFYERGKDFLPWRS